MPETPKSIALFKTCVATIMRPETVNSAALILEKAGFDVTIPGDQTCCSQISFNGGDRTGARRTLEFALSRLHHFDAIVLPSGSCAAMFARHTTDLIDRDNDLYPLAKSFARKCYEFTDFMHRFVPKARRRNIFSGANKNDEQKKSLLGYHHSCSGLRELGIYTQPRTLLFERNDMQVVDLDDSFRCCGFGGLFAIKHPLISAQMADRLIKRIKDLHIDDICGGDWGCLLHLAGRLNRLGVSVRTHHVIDVLAHGLPG